VELFRFLFFDFWIYEFWLWVKLYYISSVDLKYILFFEEFCFSFLSCYYLIGVVIAFLKGYFIFLLV